MSPAEEQFLLKMDIIVQLQEELPKRIEEIHEASLHEQKLFRLMRAKVKRNRQLRPLELREKTLVNDASELVRRVKEGTIEMCKTTLVNAGQLLGMNARWEVKIENEDQLRMYPKNGAAERLWARYKNLYMERELSRD